LPFLQDGKSNYYGSESEIKRGRMDDRNHHLDDPRHYLFVLLKVLKHCAIFKHIKAIIMKLANTVGGLAGATALTLINQGASKIDRDAPRLDLLGMNAVAKFVKPKLPIVGGLFPLALGGDLISNTMYYSLAKGSTKGNTLLRGALLGLGAGIGAITIPQRLHLNSAPVTTTTKTKLLTVAWYVLGGLVAAATMNLLDRSNAVSK